MKKFITVMLALALTGCAHQAKMNTTKNYAISEVSASEFSDKMKGLPVYFGSADGTVIKENLVSRKSSAIGSGDEAGIKNGCFRAFAAAIERFQVSAQQAGATRIIHMKSLSLQDKNTVAPEGQFICTIRGARAGVMISGDLAR